MKKYASIIFFLSLMSAFGQKGVTTFGIQYKPIIPNRFIGTFEQEFNQDQFESTVRQKWGHCAGGVIRIGLTNTISLETGINFTARNFDLLYSVPDSGYTAQGDVRVISYEIPVSGLVYIRLADQFYMNTSLGAALTYFPSDVRTFTQINSQGELFQQEGAYRSKVQGAALANLGFEYRTKEKGYWYLGASYHLPFTPIMTFAMSYEYNNASDAVVAIDNIQGSYLTLDLRYFFHENKKSFTE
jgi:hypothetical protein